MSHVVEKVSVTLAHRIEFVKPNAPVQHYQSWIAIGWVD